MKRLLAAVSLLLILFAFWVIAAPPHIDSLTYEEPGSMIVSWSGGDGGAFSLSRSDEPSSDWDEIASGLTDMVYTDTLFSAAWAWYRVEEEASDRLRINSIARSMEGVIITWDGGASNSTYAVSRSDLNLTNWMALASNLDVMVYTDMTATAAYSYYRVEAMEGEPPPVVYFEDDFETGGKPGWVQVVYDTNSNTLWEVGAPSNVGPPAANSGVNVYATNLDGNYSDNADVGLQTPAIDLGSANSVVLEFAAYYETEQFVDWVYVYIKNAAGTSNVWANAILIDSGSQDTWTELEIDVPNQVLGQEVRFEFLFQSDFSLNGPGWYIDDVTVREQE